MLDQMFKNQKPIICNTYLCVQNNNLGLVENNWKAIEYTPV